jgi:hypothetical protein
MSSENAYFAGDLVSLTRSARSTVDSATPAKLASVCCFHGRRLRDQRNEKSDEFRRRPQRFVGAADARLRGRESATGSATTFAQRGSWARRRFTSAKGFARLESPRDSCGDPDLSERSCRAPGESRVTAANRIEEVSAKR